MVVVECSAPGCAFKTDDVSEALAIALLTNHGLAHQSAPRVMAAPAQAPSPQGPKLDRPRVDMGVSIEEWSVFIRLDRPMVDMGVSIEEWNVYNCTSVGGRSSASAQA